MLDVDRDYCVIIRSNRYITYRKERPDLNTKEVLIGQIYMMAFRGDGSAQNGLRPGIVIQNNRGNKYSPNVIAIPLTSVLKKRGQPTHVFIPKGIGLSRNSIALCENPTTVPKADIREYIATLPEDLMKQVAEAYTLSTPMISFLNLEEVALLLEQSKTMNVVA